MGVAQESLELRWQTDEHLPRQEPGTIPTPVDE